MQVEIISTGDEVITGFITDTNVTYLCQELLSLGIQPKLRHTVGDNLDDIANLLKERSQVCDLILVNGGLGPTSDDNTTEAAAVAAGVPQELNESWYGRLLQWHKERNRKMPETNIKQAMLPQGATLIDNKKGTACGFRLKINKAVCIFTPGVPSEFMQMYHDEILPYIRDNFAKDANTEVKRFFLYGISESKLASLVQEHPMPKSTVIGYRADYPLLEVKIISHNANLDEKVYSLSTISQIVKPYLIVKDNFDLDEQIGELLKGKVINIYDSCTRGMACNAIAMHANVQKATIVNPYDENFNIKKISKETYEKEMQSLKDSGADLTLSIMSLPSDDERTAFAIVIKDENDETSVFKAKLPITIKEKKLATISLIVRVYLYKTLRHKAMIEPDNMELLTGDIFD